MIPDLLGARAQLFRSFPSSCRLKKSNLTLTFDKDDLEKEQDAFDNWHVENWSIFRFNNEMAKNKMTAPATLTSKILAFNGSSKAAATPNPHFALK